MVDQITFQTISIMIAAATVVIGVVNSIISNRREEKQRQEQLILQRFQGYGLEYTKAWSEVISTVDWQNVEEFQQKYSFNANPEFHSKWVYIMSIWRLAGLSLKREGDPDLIFQLYPASGVIDLWKLYEPVVEAIRKRIDDPTYMEPLEYFYNEAKKRFSETRESRREMINPII